MGEPNRPARHGLHAPPKTHRGCSSKSARRWVVWLFPIVGLASLVWFLVRVLPKPSRATYPCQRVAGPIAGGFVLWLLGWITSVAAYRGARHLFRQSRVMIACVCLVIALAAGLYSLIHTPAAPARAADSQPNMPIGEAKGIYPGRVVWVHDPDATDWLGLNSGDGYYWEPEHTDQAAVDKMFSVAIRSVTGTVTDEAAWDALFRHFNRTHGNGDVGYQPGEKISIKVNLVASIRPTSGNDSVDLTTYEQIKRQETITTSAQVMLALLRQLVYVAGVAEEDITIGDTLCYFVKHLWDVCHPEFPNVHYLDVEGRLGRTLARPSTTRLYWSNGAGGLPDYMPLSYVEAKYHINIADLKGHEGGGVTLCGKNYYGSLCRRPDAGGYYNLHQALPKWTPGYGHYRTLVDLMGHKDTGGKGLLYVIDGLWGGDDAGAWVRLRWYSAPFNGDWPSSLFVSQDPVAIDSVAFDFLLAEWPNDFPGTVYGADDYLHEAALADNPPSGTFYDPEGDGIRMQSLGVHEHWNNAIDKQYSRNLGTGDGIELIALRAGQPGDCDYDFDVDVFDVIVLVNAFGSRRGDRAWNAAADFDNDNLISVFDAITLVNNFGAGY